MESSTSITLFALVFFSSFIVLLFSQTENISIVKGPRNFLFGTASSCYQFEGAFLSDGKGLNNWDVFTHETGHIADGSNGDIAIDHYNRYLEDIKLMKDMGVNSFRFSISWARILPKGMYGGVNMAGIQHYNKLIDALLHKGIQPFITLTHYDIPQELEERYGGWLSPKIQRDFGYYGDICFKYFGDKVKYWVTINEPNVMAVRSYRLGTFPPARCSGSFGNCSFGNSEKEPFIAAHNMILSHAAVVTIYRTKYQETQGGMIGISLNTQWYEPFSNSLEDNSATQRARSFVFNCCAMFLNIEVRLRIFDLLLPRNKRKSLRHWGNVVDDVAKYFTDFLRFLDPIIFGKYPEEMQQILGNNLPVFSGNDMKNLKNGLDFIGLNHYTAAYIKDCLYSPCEYGKNSWSEGSYFRATEKDGVYIGEPTTMDWLFVYPQGMEKLVMYMKERFNNTPIIITENGIAEADNPNSSLEEALNDTQRVEYMHSYLNSLANAMRKGADVRGYFAWSLLDNFEWLDGYTKRFGLHYVNFTNLHRSPKLSATRYKELISNFQRQLATYTV